MFSHIAFFADNLDDVWGGKRAQAMHFFGPSESMEQEAEHDYHVFLLLALQLSRPD